MKKFIIGLFAAALDLSVIGCKGGAAFFNL